MDFGYPLGQAFYISIALLVFFTSRNFLGGVLKKPIIFLIVALFFQYISDFNFLYQASAGTWYVGGVGDYLYAVSYFVMALAIIYIGTVSQKIRTESLSSPTAMPQDGLMTEVQKLFNQILTEIIQRQEKVAGNLVWEEVRKIDSIKIIDQSNFVIDIKGDAKKAIDQLVFAFKNLFGDMAVEVSKNAVRYLTAELPADEVPDSLK